MAHEKNRDPARARCGLALCEACDGSGFEEGEDWLDPAAAICSLCYGAGGLEATDPEDRPADPWPRGDGDATPRPPEA